MDHRTPRIRTLSPHEQLAWMRQERPDFTSKITDATLVCHGALQPMPLSAVYRVVITYAGGQKPRAWVPAPQLARRDFDEPIPHTYGPEQPCLFLPAEWRSDRKISATIIPWLSLWLFHYEVWRATGVWHGGGVHPTIQKTE